jgi:hypothetical protein
LSHQHRAGEVSTKAEPVDLSNIGPE